MSFLLKKKKRVGSQHENNVSFWKGRTAHLINKMDENVKMVSVVGEYIRMKTSNLSGV